MNLVEFLVRKGESAGACAFTGLWSEWNSWWGGWARGWHAALKVDGRSEDLEGIPTSQQTQTSAGDAYRRVPIWSCLFRWLRKAIPQSCLPTRSMMHERGGAGTRPLRLTMVTGKKKVLLLPSCLLRPDLGMSNHAWCMGNNNACTYDNHRKLQATGISYCKDHISTRNNRPNGIRRRVQTKNTPPTTSPSKIFLLG